MHLTTLGFNKELSYGTQPVYFEMTEKLNYDFRKDLPVVEIRATDPVEEFEFISYIVNGPCEKPWLKERDPRVR
jgi:hypothetical protein